MAYLRVIGSPFPPSGVLLERATLRATLLDEYADGLHRYARTSGGVYVRTDADQRWKPAGSVDGDGTFWYLPGGLAGEASPRTRFIERQDYSDGTSQLRTWQMSVTGEDDGTWLYSSSVPGGGTPGGGTGEEMATPTIMLSGTVTTATAAAPLGASTPTMRVLVQNPYTNTVDVTVGTAATQPIVLRPGTDSGWIDIDNLSKVSIKSASGTPVCGYMAVCP